MPEASERIEQKLDRALEEISTLKEQAARVETTLKEWRATYMAMASISGQVKVLWFLAASSFIAALKVLGGLVSSLFNNPPQGHP